MRINNWLKGIIFTLLLLLVSACNVQLGGGDGTADTDAPPKTNDEHIDVETISTEFTGVADGQPVPSLEGKNIGVAVIGTTHNFDRQAYQGQIDRIKELGGNPIPVDGERNDQKHIADIENLLTQKPDAIIKELGDTAVYEPVMKKVHDAGIPIFTIDHPSPYSITNHLSDNYYIGESLARKMFEDIGGEGTIVVFNGFSGVRVCEIRYDMMKYVAQDYPGIKFIEPELQDIIPGTVEDARKKIQDLLVKYPNKGDIDAVWAAWDLPSIGAAQAIDAAGRSEINVYGVDAEPAAIELVADPNSSLTADVAQKPYKIGQAAVDTVARYLAGLDVPKSVYIETELITKDNAEEYLAEIKE
ncbi:sugar ABC transporter substrate-binding protein [Bacillus sp. Marseille-P3661]|uniref:sugar ABC transporter substrate-binding protein n=1 Tax=Bacillus sp. Marseille-P3661 TaxID=1936234 RepID=UPI000C86225B|nr:sugar ABC transporter substrate-binding protein [Bacillus sp. Marseille-P3661]